MTSRPGWTVRPISIPDSLDSPDAWVLHGLVAVQREVHEASWGHADLHLPAEMRLAVMRDQMRTERLGFVAVRDPLPQTPGPEDVLGVSLVTMERTGNTHAASMGVLVRPERVHEGIGTALADATEAAVAAKGRTTVILDIEHPGEPPVDAPDVVTPPTGAGRIAGDAAGVAFARGRGYSLEQGERFSTLHLPLPDDSVVDTFLTESLAAAGDDYETVTWQNTCPEDLIGEMAALATLMTTAVPVAGLDLVEHVWTVEELRQQEATNREAGHDTLVTAVRHRPSGRLVAYSEIAMPTLYRWLAFQDDTLVDPAHRGHRLGMLMKAKNLVELRTLRPDLARLHTWNAEENRHMLSINEALGFEPTGVVALWQKKLV